MRSSYETAGSAIPYGLEPLRGAADRDLPDFRHGEQVQAARLHKIRDDRVREDPTNVFGPLRLSAHLNRKNQDRVRIRSSPRAQDAKPGDGGDGEGAERDSGDQPRSTSRAIPLLRGI